MQRERGPAGEQHDGQPVTKQVLDRHARIGRAGIAMDEHGLAAAGRERIPARHMHQPVRRMRRERASHALLVQKVDFRVAQQHALVLALETRHHGGAQPARAARNDEFLHVRW